VALNSRMKGKVGELEAAMALRQLFNFTTRRSQQHSGCADSADLQVDQTPTLWWEIKRVERLNIANTMTKAVEQSGDRTPVVMHRPNRFKDGWMITIKLSDLPALMQAFQDSQTNGKIATKELAEDA